MTTRWLRARWAVLVVGASVAAVVLVVHAALRAGGVS